MRSSIPTLLAGTLLLASLIFLLPRLVAYPTWSVFYLLHEHPAWVRFAVVLLPAPLALLLHGPLREPVARRLGGLAERLPPRALLCILGALALCVFWVFRETRHWGDGEMTVAILEGRAPVPALGRWFWREPLDRLLAMGATALARRVSGAGAEAAVAWLSCAAGALFAALLVPLARLLARGTLARVFVWGFVLSMGASQLFFGHVENYTLVTVAMLAFFLVCTRLLREQGALWSAWLVAALTVTVHVQGAFLIAPLLTLVVLVRGHAWRTLRELAESALPGVAYLLCFYAFGRWLGAPPLEVGANRFAGQAGVVLDLEEALRGRHLWNVLQGYLLTVPFGALLVLPGALVWKTPRVWRDPVAQMLAAGCLSFGLFNLFFDAQLARRLDWSLFAPAALPVALLAARAFALRLDAGRSTSVVGTFLVLLSLALSGTWIASNTLARSRSRADRSHEAAPAARSIDGRAMLIDVSAGSAPH